MTTPARELANEIHSTFASAYAIGESVSHEWLVKTIELAMENEQKRIEWEIRYEIDSGVAPTCEFILKRIINKIINHKE